MIERLGFASDGSETDHDVVYNLNQLTQSLYGFESIVQTNYATNGQLPLMYDHVYSKQNGIYTFTGYAYKGNKDVSEQFNTDMFVWYLRTDSGDSLYSRGRHMTISEEAADLRASIIGGLDEILIDDLADDLGELIVDSGNNTYNVYGIWEVA